MRRYRPLSAYTGIHGVKTVQADGELYFEPANKGLKAYDALGFDRVPQSPSKHVPIGYNVPNGPATFVRRVPVTLAEAMANKPVTARPAKVHNIESLINTKPRDLSTLVKVTRSRVHNGFTYTDNSDAAKRRYLEANSLDQVLLPTAANDLCFKCGLTVSCVCHKPIRHDATASKPVTAKPASLHSNKRIDRVRGLSDDVLSDGAIFNDMLTGRIVRAEVWIVDCD